MKLMLSFIVLSILLFLGLCEAQFFGGFGGATQNCAGSQCNQNNFGRKKREILSELLDLAEIQAQDDRIGDQLIADGIGQERNKRKAQFPGFGFGGATQNCAGSQCNQNNFGRKKRAIVDAIIALAEEETSREKREAEAQLQNCQGSSCNQNNFGGGVASGVVPVGGSPVLFNGSPVPFGHSPVPFSDSPVPFSDSPVAFSDSPVSFSDSPVPFSDSPVAFSDSPVPFNGSPVAPSVILVAPIIPVAPVSPVVPVAPVVPIAPVAAAAQNCVGSDCNQNNAGKKKREAQVQNCQGSQCNQNNAGVGVGFGGFPGGVGGFGASQNCVGSSCNQNNFGRKKRAVIKAILDEAQKITEDDLETELEEVETEADNSNVFKSISSYLRGLFLLSDPQFNLRFISFDSPDGSSSSLPLPTISPTEATPVHILECSGPTTSYCNNHHCRVKCFDGRKVELKCDSNSIVIKNSAVGEDLSRNEVSCG